MNSRMERHYELHNSSSNKRTFRNQDLYKKIYEDTEYTNVEGITSIGRTNDIDISKIKDLLKSREEYKKERESIVTAEPVKDDQTKDDDERNYDIRDILSRAKNERQTSDDKMRSLDNEKYNILRRIDTAKANTYKSISEIEKEENELKELLQTLTSTTLIKKMDDKDLSIDIFDELKSSDNTEVVGIEPSMKEIMNASKDEYQKEDDDDDDKIEIDKSFYTNGFNLDAKDFEDLKEVGVTVRKNNILIIIVLILLFAALLGIGIYFGYQAL